MQHVYGNEKQNREQISVYIYKAHLSIFLSGVAAVTDSLSVRVAAQLHL